LLVFLPNILLFAIGGLEYFPLFPVPMFPLSLILFLLPKLNKILELKEPDIVVREIVKEEPVIVEETTTKVKFLESVDLFVGKELEEYGPFEKEAEATLPKDLADILISQGKAI